MSRRRRAPTVVFALAAIVAALAAVAWRQSKTRETMQELARVERDLAVALDEREGVAREVVALESRWVTAEAARRLGLRPPAESEIVITSGAAR